MIDYSGMFKIAAEYYHKKFSVDWSVSSDEVSTAISAFLYSMGHSKEEVLLSGVCIKRRSTDKIYCDRVKRTTVDTLKIGYAGKDGQGLYEHLKRQGFDDETILGSGLCYSIDYQIFDTLKNRIVFPAYNRQGAILGLVSKSISKGVNQDAILNLINPSVPDAKDEFFTFDYDGDKRGYAILCDNPFDAVYMYDKYVKNAVGILGGTLEITEQQLNLIKDSGSTVRIVTADTSYLYDMLKIKLKEKGVRIL